MPTLQLKCSCGQFRGIVENFSIESSGRAFCYCDDCQAYAHWLGRARELDAHGGTDITPVRPAHFKILEGREQLRCLHLTEKGLNRWYTECCKSPIANAAAPTLPYLGLITTCIDADPVESAVGRVHFRMMAKYAIGTPPRPFGLSIPFSAIIWMMRYLAVGLFRGLARDNPLFAANGSPTVRPRVLSFAEREHLRQFCGPVVTAKAH